MVTTSKYDKSFILEASIKKLQKAATAWTGILESAKQQEK